VGDNPRGAFVGSYYLAFIIAGIFWWFGDVTGMLCGVGVAVLVLVCSLVWEHGERRKRK